VSENQKPQGYVQKSQPDHGQAHDRPTSKSNRQSAIERTTSCIGCPAGGISGSFHAKIARESREKTASQESYRDPLILNFKNKSQKAQQNYQTGKNNSYHCVLLL